MANPIQQGLKLSPASTTQSDFSDPQWLIQYNKDWNEGHDRKGSEQLNPQWLIQYNKDWNPIREKRMSNPRFPAMANPIQQGLKHS